MFALIFHFFSFLIFDLYFKKHILGNFRSYGLAFVPKCYQYSWCNQLLICYKYMYIGGLHNGRQILLSNYNHLIYVFFKSRLGCS